MSTGEASTRARLKLEVWTSSEQRQERHYFLQGEGARGYQEGIYLFGLNPLRVTREQERKILALLGFGEASEHER